MESLFNEIEGKSGEDFTTLILKYILISDKSLCKTLFDVNSIDKGIISTQKRILNGRFDLFIEDDENCLIIENKFYANFTNVNNEHQLLRYYNWLSDQNYNTKKLIVLTIKRRKNEVDIIFKSLISNTHILKEIIFWEDLINKLDINNVIHQELATFINAKYLQSIILDSWSVEMLSTKDNAQTYNKILKLVVKIHDLLEDDKINVQRVKYEDNSYGFYFKKKGKEYWFGFDPVFWEKTGNLIDLQYRVKNIKDNTMNFIQIEGLYFNHYLFSKDDILSDETLLEKLNIII